MGGALLFGIAAAFVARYKGFAPFRWLLSFGLIGLIVVCFLRSSNIKGPSPISEEESIRRRTRANEIGAMLCALNVILLVAVLIYVAGSLAQM